MAHPDRDAFWQARDPRPHYTNIKPAVLVVGGWFDAEDRWGALQTYRAMETQTKPNNKVHLVMGPWTHGGWARGDGDRVGDVEFGAKTSTFYQQQIELPFFEQHLKGVSSSSSFPEVFSFRTGSNEWHRFEAWPPKQTTPRSLFFGADGTLTTVSSSSSSSGVSWTADPAHPVPFMDGVRDEVSRDYMTADQRFASRRPDVLTFNGPVLREDVVVAGPIEVDLALSTTGGDIDVVVKLIDVLPQDALNTKQTPATSLRAGAQQLVRAEVFRARYREGFDRPKPFVAGRVERVRFTLPDVHHAFRSGHRLQVQVQASWFPLIDRNPQRWVDNINAAVASDFVVATHTLHTGGVGASKIVLPTLPPPVRITP